MTSAAKIMYLFIETCLLCSFVLFVELSIPTSLVVRPCHQPTLVTRAAVINAGSTGQSSATDRIPRLKVGREEGQTDRCSASPLSIPLARVNRKGPSRHRASNASIAFVGIYRRIRLTYVSLLAETTCDAAGIDSSAGSGFAD
jgi:hypothetical protein